LSLDEDKISSAMKSIDSKVAENAKAIEECQSSLNDASSKAVVQIESLDASLKEIEDMVFLSKNVLKHVAESILATPLIDSEAVQALSKLLESIHISISEFIQVYRDKQDFVNRVKMSWI